MSVQGNGVDTGLDTEVESNPLFEEFLRRERSAQGDAEVGTASAPEGEPPAEGTPETAPVEPAPEAPTEGGPLAPGAPSTEPLPVEPDLDEPPAPAEPVEPEAPIEPSAESTGPQPWAFGGVEYDQNSVARMVALDNWARSMSQEQRTAVDLLLTGQYRLAPVNEPQPQPVQPQPQPIQPQPTPLAEDDELLDPAVRSRFDALNNELNSLRQSSQAVQQQQLAAQQQQIVNGLDTGRQTFQQAHELSDDEAFALVNQVVNLQVLPSYLAAHNGDATAAMHAALEAQYWASPSYQQRELDRRAADAKSQETTQVRTRKVSAITGSGGSTAPRVETPPADPRQGRRDAMVKEIADHLNGNTAN
jgi:hypothetical protein